MLANYLQQQAWFKQSLRLLLHEFRRGELTIIFLAIVLAVASVFALNGFSGMIQQALTQQSANTIAADRVLRSNQPADADFLAKANELSLQLAQKISTESMAFYQDNMLLAEVVAVSDIYPLKGQLTIKRTVASESESVHAPLKGEAWVEQSVLARLNTHIGETIDIGMASFVVAGIIEKIPDRSYRAFVVGPTIIINAIDIPETALIQAGSRIAYKYLFAGTDGDLTDFGQWLTPQLNDTQSWYDAKKAQNRLSNVLTRAEKFLSLASMLGIILAAVSVAVATRRYAQRHQSSVAIFKALGAGEDYIKRVYFLHWGLLSLVSIFSGLIIGYLLLVSGMQAIESYVSLANTQLTFKPFIIAITTGLICALAFAVWPLKELMSTLALSVHNKGSIIGEIKYRKLYQLLPFVALFILLLLFTHDVIMSISLIVAGAIVVVVLLLLGQLFVHMGRSVGVKAGKSWHLALANLKRRANESAIQLISFTIAIKLLLIIMVMKYSLISEWQLQFPADTPNHYLINITEDEIEPLAVFSKQHSIETQGFYYITRGRLSAINNEPTVIFDDSDEQNKNKKGRRGLGRELGLTWRTDLPVGNELTQGQWWAANDETPQVSVAQGVAERLEINLGDKLSFDVGSQVFTVSVTSIRAVNWESRQLNFVMIFNESALATYQSTAISAWMIPDAIKNETYQFFARFPTMSIIDITAIMTQLNQLIDQLTIAIELILILVVLAGSLVLVAQVQASMEERERELAILKTLGAKGSLLRHSILFEFVALGAIAGLMASIAMEVSVYILQSQVFAMTPQFHFSYWLLGIVCGAGFVGFVGMLSCWRLLRLPSMTLIRNTM